MRKKYFVRALAALPMLSVGISMMVFLVMAFSEHFWVLLAIGNFWAFSILARDYEWYVRKLSDFIEEMVEDAVYE